MKVKQNNFLTAYEISEYLRIPLNTIYRLTKNGKIKGFKIGKQWRYSREDIEEYLSKGVDFSNMAPRKTGEFRERREYPRMNCNLGCRYNVEIQSLKEFKSNTGSIRNISGGGVFLCDKPENLAQISVGDPIEIDFNLPQGQNIKTYARVVRRAENGMAIYGVGIKFRNIDQNYQDIIRRYVD